MDFFYDASGSLLDSGTALLLDFVMSGGFAVSGDIHFIAGPNFSNYGFGAKALSGVGDLTIGIGLLAFGTLSMSGDSPEPDQQVTSFGGVALAGSADVVEEVSFAAVGAIATSGMFPPVVAATIDGFGGPSASGSASQGPITASVAGSGSITLAGQDPEPDGQVIGDGTITVSGTADATAAGTFVSFAASGRIRASAVNPQPDFQALPAGGGTTLSSGATDAVPYATIPGTGRMSFSGAAPHAFTIAQGGMSLRGQAFVFARSTPTDCYPLPFQVVALIGCPTSQVPCVDASTSPPTPVCRNMVFLFSPQYFSNGYTRAGLSGAYVPVNTVCQTGMQPVPFSRLSQNPSARYVGY